MKIIFTGPECSGKTTMVKEFCDKTDFIEVPEIAREYLSIRNNIYNEHNLIEIGLLQHWEESRLEAMCKNICCDTDLLTILIWQSEKFQNTDQFLLKKWSQSQPDLYFLCTPDIAWEDDVQRENPYDRERLFWLYHDYLTKYQKQFAILTGSLEERMKQVLSIIPRII